MKLQHAIFSLLVACALPGCLEDLGQYTLPDAGGNGQAPDMTSDAGGDDAGGDSDADAAGDDVDVDVVEDMAPADVDMVDCTAETDEEFCERNRAFCGAFEALDNCGAQRTADCGSCIAPNTCGGGEIDNICDCTPLTDEQFCMVRGAECGTTSGTDICGAPRTTSCGTCADDERCSGNVCVCRPETDEELCSQEGANCGELVVMDRCMDERTLDCGSCDEPESCGGGVDDNVCGCTPESDTDFCSRLTADCGLVTADDNCGMERVDVDCGPMDCDDPTGEVTCGGGGTPNVCACSTQSDSEFCAAYGAECGALTEIDDCGNERTVNCGDCSGFETCGGGPSNDDDNICGCTSELDSQFCARLGYECGSVTDTDNCGDERTVDCGTCPSDETCGVVSPNACDCVPDDRPTFCASHGAECGQFSGTDNCGDDRTENCGSCGSGEACQGNLCICQPENDSQFCSRLNGCGSVTADDNCGMERTVECGDCGDGEGNCIDNVCSDCTPESDTEFCSRVGTECGPESGTDNCGSARSTDCGTCAGDEFECQSGTCVCVGESASELCTAEGADCGSITVTDQCGDSRTVSCGGCSGEFDSCQSNRCVCQPESDDKFCENNDAECGTFSGTDRCGNSRSVNCGGCGLLVCTNNSCL